MAAALTSIAPVEAAGPRPAVVEIPVACYGTNYSGAPWNGRSVMVACTEDCVVNNAPTCYDVAYSPPRTPFRCTAKTS
jgi:hypothetical protein